MPNLTFNDAKAASEATGTTLDLGVGTTVFVYSLDPGHQAEFIQYYVDTVLPWLKERGMEQGKGWIVNHQLIYTSTPPTPWSGITGIEKYLSKEHPPLALELPYGDGSGDYNQTQTVPTEAQAS